MSENPVRQKFSRHIDMRKYYVRELVLNGSLKLVPLRTHKMVADALTKSLAFVGQRQIMVMLPSPLDSYVASAANFERCVFHNFRLIVYIFFSPSTLRPVGLSCV